jgi:hypothetical protein
MGRIKLFHIITTLIEDSFTENIDLIHKILSILKRRELIKDYFITPYTISILSFDGFHLTWTGI